MDRRTFPTELKLAAGAVEGIVTGMASVYGVLDSHGDVVVPGAFTAGLEARKAAGRGLPPMRIMHGGALGADPRPAGVWTSIEDTSHGLKVTGQLSGMDTDQGRYNLALIKDGALKNLSVGFVIPPGGAIYGKSASEPQRTITTATLAEISIVDDGSNPRATLQLKSAADLAELLREAGLSKAAARKLAHGGFGALGGEDPTDDGPDPAALQSLLKRLETATLEIKAAGTSRTYR